MIETPRLVICPFTESDRNAVVSLLQNETFMQFSADGAFDSDGAHARFDQILSHAAAGFGKQAIILKQAGDLIGYCGIEPFILDGREEYELGYRLLPEYRGMGMATEAARAVADSYKGKLFAYVDAANSKSVRILLDIGFTRHGRSAIHGKSYEIYCMRNTDG